MHMIFNESKDQFLLGINTLREILSDELISDLDPSLIMTISSNLVLLLIEDTSARLSDIMEECSKIERHLIYWSDIFLLNQMKDNLSCHVRMDQNISFSMMLWTLFTSL